MPEPKKDNKKLSLRPLNFEEALKGLLETEPSKETQEKKATSKRRQKQTSGNQIVPLVCLLLLGASSI